MTIRQRIWEDLYQCKYQTEYITRYLAQSKDFAKWYKAILIVLAATGAIGWQFDKEVAFFICILIFLSQVGESLQNLFVLDDSKIAEMGEYRLMYVKYFDGLDLLWTSLELNVISEQDALERYFQIREDAMAIETFDNKIRIKTRSKLITKAESTALLYMNRHYFEPNSTNDEQDQ